MSRSARRDPSRRTCAFRSLGTWSPRPCSLRRPKRAGHEVGERFRWVTSRRSRQAPIMVGERFETLPVQAPGTAPPTRVTRTAARTCAPSPRRPVSRDLWRAHDRHRRSRSPTCPGVLLPRTGLPASRADSPAAGGWSAHSVCLGPDVGLLEIVIDETGDHVAQLSARGDPELGEHVVEMRADGAVREVEPGADLAVG